MALFTISYSVGGGVTPYIATLSGATDTIVEVHTEDGTYEFNHIEDGTYNFNVVDSGTGDFNTQLVVGTGVLNTETEGLGEGLI